MLTAQAACRGGAVIAFFALLTACARPQDTSITQFANSTIALATFAKNTNDLNAQLDAKYKGAEAAQSYVDQGTITLPPPKGTFLGGQSDADRKLVEGFLDAVSEYSTALAKANDPTLETALSGEVSKLGTSVSKISAARSLGSQSTAVQNRITLIGGVVADLVQIASDLYATAQIRAAIAAVQPVLERAQKPLTTAIKAVQIDNRTRLERYRAALVQKLRYGRDGPAGMTSVEKYDLYLSTSADYAAMAASVDALQNLDQAISAMIKAHAALLTDADKKAALLAFLATVSDIADKVQKMRAPASS